jgi:hypothetical protein
MQIADGRLQVLNSEYQIAVRDNPGRDLILTVKPEIEKPIIIIFIKKNFL